MTKTNELLPCPFCGAKAEMEPWHGGSPTKQLIQCMNEICDACPAVTGETPEEAIANWNCRAPEPQPEVAAEPVDAARLLKETLFALIKAGIVTDMQYGGVLIAPGKHARISIEVYDPLATPSVVEEAVKAERDANIAALQDIYDNPPSHDPGVCLDMAMRIIARSATP